MPHSVPGSSSPTDTLLDAARPPTPGRPHNPYQLLDQADDLNARIHGLQAALEHHERLATLGTIAGLIAHEFNNILTPVMSYAQMALAKPDDHALAHKALTRAVEGTERAAAIASAILGFVRDESSVARKHATPMGGNTDVPRGTSLADGSPPESARCEVEVAIHDAIACLARDPAKDGIELTLDLEPNLIAAIRPIALQHVLLNLMLNARRAMLPAGGTLTIRARRSEAPPVADAGDAVGVQPTSGGIGAGWIVIDVMDSGCGMDAGQLARLFKAFYTTGETERSPGSSTEARGRSDDRKSGGDRRSGTGLGMTICTRLIADCGGVLIARSGLGRGTTLTVGVRAA